MKRKKNGAKTAILCIFKGETLLIITSGKAAIFGGITEMAKEEKDKIIQTYKDVNKVGIKSYNYMLLMKALIRLLIYAIIMNFMVNLL